MRKRKYAKAFMLGLCLSTLFVGAAFAETVDNEEEYTIQITSVDSELDDMHSKVNQYVFEDHFEEFQKLGFTITHTAPMEGYIEVGISPFSEAYANNLYDALGRDVIKVVEGDESILYTTTAMDGAPDAVTSSDVEQQEVLDNQEEEDGIVTDTSLDLGQEQAENMDVVKTTEKVSDKNVSSKSNSVLLVIGIAGIAILLGGVLFFTNKKKLSK